MGGVKCRVLRRTTVNYGRHRPVGHPRFTFKRLIRFSWTSFVSDYRGSLSVEEPPSLGKGDPVSKETPRSVPSHPLSDLFTFPFVLSSLLSLHLCHEVSSFFLFLRTFSSSFLSLPVSVLFISSSSFFYLPKPRSHCHVRSTRTLKCPKTNNLGS